MEGEEEREGIAKVEERREGRDPDRGDAVLVVYVAGLLLEYRSRRAIVSGSIPLLHPLPRARPRCECLLRKTLSANGDPPPPSPKSGSAKKRCCESESEDCGELDENGDEVEDEEEECVIEPAWTECRRCCRCPTKYPAAVVFESRSKSDGLTIPEYKPPLKLLRPLYPINCSSILSLWCPE